MAPPELVDEKFPEIIAKGITTIVKIDATYAALSKVVFDVSRFEMYEESHTRIAQIPIITPEPATNPTTRW